MVKLSALLFIIIGISLVAGACNKSPSNAQTGSVADSVFKELVLEIPTITCIGCRSRVEASARSVSGVMDVKFDRKSTTKVIIVFDPAQTSPSVIIKSIEENGDKVVELSQ